MRYIPVVTASPFFDNECEATRAGEKFVDEVKKTDLSKKVSEIIEILGDAIKPVQAIVSASR